MRLEEFVIAEYRWQNLTAWCFKFAWQPSLSLAIRGHCHLSPCGTRRWSTWRKRSMLALPSSSLRCFSTLRSSLTLSRSPKLPEEESSKIAEVQTNSRYFTVINFYVLFSCSCLYYTLVSGLVSVRIKKCGPLNARPVPPSKFIRIESLPSRSAASMRSMCPSCLESCAWMA